MSIDNSGATITTRYRKDQMEVYQGVMDLIKEHTPNLSKSLAQFLLVERGLQHTQNPEPLTKEVEKKVYVDRPGKTVEKTVYVDRPGKTIEKKVYVPVVTPALKDEHIEVPKAKEKKENPKEEESSSNGSIWSWIFWIGVGSLTTYGIIKSFTKYT